MKEYKTCKTKGCTANVVLKGMCRRCYQRNYYRTHKERMSAQQKKCYREKRGERDKAQAPSKKEKRVFEKLPKVNYRWIQRASPDMIQSIIDEAWLLPLRRTKEGT